MFVCLFFKKVNAKGLRSSLLFPHFISNKSCLAWLWWVLRSQISQPGINKILLYIYLSVPLRDRSLQLGQMRSKIYCHTWSLIKTLWSSTKKKKVVNSQSSMWFYSPNKGLYFWRTNCFEPLNTIESSKPATGHVIDVPFFLQMASLISEVRIFSTFTVYLKWTSTFKYYSLLNKTLALYVIIVYFMWLLCG